MSISDSPQEKKKQKIFKVENLTYTYKSLIAAILLILMGFFCFSFSLNTVSVIMPLKLKALGADSKTIVLIMGTIGQILNIILCPMVSYQSDRFRSKRWGRRVPFILFTMPMLVAAWVMFAFAESASSVLYPAISSFVNLAPTTFTIIIMAIIMFVYNFFYMYVGSVIYYIYNDTIPAQFLARMVGMIQVVSGIASMAFNFLVFKHGLEHFRTVFLLTAAVYVAGVGTMCFLLKEPRFPDPAPEEKKKSKGLSGIKTFICESYTNRFYLCSYLGICAVSVANIITTFEVFFHQYMGLSLEEIGNMNGIKGVVYLCISFAIASFGTILVDRWHPVRVNIFTGLMLPLVMLFNCKWIFIQPPADVYLLLSIITTGVNLAIVCFWGVSSMPMLMRTYPKSRFGQFCSAQSMLRSGSVLFLSLIFGAVIDLLKENAGLGESAYRFIYAWQFLWYLLGVGGYLLFYRQFSNLGGYAGFKAPAKWLPGGYEEMPITEVSSPSAKGLQTMLNIFAGIYAFGVIIPLGLYAICRYNTLLTYIFPCALVPAVLYAILHIRLSMQARKVAAGTLPLVRLPHYSIMILAAILQILILLMGAAEVLLCNWKNCPPEVGCKMLIYEYILSVLLVFILFVYAKLEPQKLPSASAQ